MVNASNKNINKWVFKHLGDNIYTIKNVGSNRFLVVAQAECSNGANVGSWTNSGAKNQRWKVLKNRNNYTLKPLHCMDRALDKNNGDNNNVHLWKYWSDNNNQKWEISTN